MSYIKVVGRPISRTLVHSFAGGVNTRNDESVLPISTAKNCYNFKFESGYERQRLYIGRLVGGMRLAILLESSGAKESYNHVLSCR